MKIKIFIQLAILIILLPISAIANDCKELPEKIRKCEKYSCKIQTDQYNFIITHNVIGLTPNGKCKYNSTVPVPANAPNDLIMDCLFTKEIQEAYANIISNSLGIDTEKNISADSILVNKALAKDICEIKGLDMGF